MRKMIGLVAVALAFGSVANAQGTVAFSEGVSATPVGCTRLADNALACGVDLRWTGKGETGSTRYNNSSISALVGGTQYSVGRIALGTQQPTELSSLYLPEISLFKAAPTRVYFIIDDVPANAVRADAIRNVRDNTAVTGFSAGTQSTARSTPTTNVAAGGYNVNLTGCTPRSGGSYSCTGATVTPQR